jgi:nucleolar complex protein 2
LEFGLESGSENEDENGEDGDGGFDMNGDEDGAMEEEDERLPVLTRDVIKGWQKAILEVRLVPFLPSFSLCVASVALT